MEPTATANLAPRRVLENNHFTEHYTTTTTTTATPPTTIQLTATTTAKYVNVKILIPLQLTTYSPITATNTVNNLLTFQT